MAPRKTGPPAASTHHMKTRSQRRREQAEAEAAAKAAAEAAAEAAKQEEEDDDDDDEEEGEQDKSEEVSENEDVSENADENDDNDNEGQDNGDVENQGNDEGENDEDEINSNGKRSRSHSESPPPSPKKPRLEEDDSGESENDEEDENEDQEDQDEDQDENKDEDKDDNKDNEGDDEMTDPDEDQDNNEPQKPNGPADKDDHMTDNEEGPQADGDENNGEDHGKIVGGPTAIDQFANNSNNNDNNIVQNNAPQHTIIRDDYWPNIRPYFERLHQDYVNGSSNEQRNTEIQIPCCVCHNMTSVPFSSEHYPAGPHDHQELAAVLPCGHLIGLDCLTEWRRQADFIPLPCPYCRRPLDCEDCFVPLRVYVLNQVDVPPPTSFPANSNEGGLCNTCHSRNSFIVNTVLMPDLRPGIANPSNGLLRQWVAQEASREYREQRRIHETTSSHCAATFLNVFSTLRSEANNMQQQFMSQYPALQRLEFDANNQRPWNAPFDCPPNSNASSTSPQISNHLVDSFNSTVYTDSGNASIDSLNSTIYPPSGVPSIDSFNSTVYPPSGFPSIDSFNSTVYPTSSDTSVPFIGYDGSTDTSSSSFFEEARWQGHTGESDSDASNGGSSSTDVQYWIDFMRRQNPH